MRVRTTALVMLTAACSIGPGPGDYTPDATGPRGALGTLTMRGAAPIRIELIEVRDSALVVLGPAGYALAPFDAIRGINLTPHLFTQQFTPHRRTIERMTSISRFPHRIPPGVLDELLRGANQTALIVLGADRR